jgi:hypothetical protein
MSRKVKSVSFNLNDPWESEMYDYTLKFPNFSSFVKRLIQNSIQGKIESIQQVKHVPETIINQEYIKQLI